MDYWKEYSSDAVGAKRSGKPDRDSLKKKRNMIKEYLK